LFTQVFYTYCNITHKNFGLGIADIGLKKMDMSLLFF
jgi:hypothetical protein